MISVSGLGSHLSHKCWVLDLESHLKGLGSWVSGPTYEIGPGSRVSDPSESPGSRVSLFGYAILTCLFIKDRFDLRVCVVNRTHVLLFALLLTCT